MVQEGLVLFQLVKPLVSCFISFSLLSFPCTGCWTRQCLSLQDCSDMDKLTAGLGEGVPEAVSRDSSNPLAKSVISISVFY